MGYFRSQRPTADPHDRPPVFISSPHTRYLSRIHVYHPSPPAPPPNTWRPLDYGRSAISISGKPGFSLAQKSCLPRPVARLPCSRSSSTPHPHNRFCQDPPTPFGRGNSRTWDPLGNLLGISFTLARGFDSAHVSYSMKTPNLGFLFIFG